MFIFDANSTYGLFGPCLGFVQYPASSRDLAVAVVDGITEQYQ